MTEPTYFERDRYDLPLPLIGANPDFAVSEPAILEQQRLEHNSIVRALTQILSPLDVRFQFSIASHPQAQPVTVTDSEHTILQSPDECFQPLAARLKVQCHSPQNLDSQIIAAPLAQTLRQLNLQGFQDAIVEFFQYAPASGNQIANWRLKLDLTPPSVRLKSWARWGDVQAIAKLLNLALAPEGIQVSAVLKNLTLQIFCSLTNSRRAKFPPKTIAIDIIAPLLIELAPQGIQRATIHGMSQPTDQQTAEPPGWMHWLDLPALGDPKSSPTPIVLAARGNDAALTFMLERLLNPDLEQCFVIGGITLSLTHRSDMLDVISDAPICPTQHQVVPTVINLLRQLSLPGVRGVRVQGRISGQLLPLWTDEVDFDRPRLDVPPVPPEHQFGAEPSPISWSQKISADLAATGIWTPQFTSATSQLVYQHRFQWQPSLLLLLVGLGLAIVSDLAIKFALETRHLTARSVVTNSQLSFNNPLLEQKLAQYQLRCLQHGVPDVLIIGSSRALRGVNPEILQRSLSDRGYANLQIYNFGINGSTAQVVDLILRQLLTPQQLPKLVIWADGARAFNSGRADRTYETIALSDRYRQLALMSGINHNSSLFQAQSSFQNTYQAIDRTIDRELAKISPAYDRRDLLKAWLQTKLPSARQIADSGNSLLNSLDPGANMPEPKLDRDGFLALELQFDPATYYQKYTKVTGDNDGDYANFQLPGNQDRALNQTIDLLATRKIPLVFVNLPLSDLYLDKFRLSHEASFKQYMQNLTESNRLTFIDMDGFLNQQYDRFSDPSHLNQLGAREVSRYLAQTTLIPWHIFGADIVGGN